MLRKFGAKKCPAVVRANVPMVCHHPPVDERPGVSPDADGRTVVGTHALYAYEAAASVRFEAGVLDTSLLKLIKRADPSFLRRMAAEGDPHPFRLTEDDGDLWPVQAQRAEDFLNAPRYEWVVFSTTGRMALMRTVSPAVFVAFKRWMAGFDNRPAGKRRRDLGQADIVQQLLDEKGLEA